MHLSAAAVNPEPATRSRPGPPPRRPMETWPDPACARTACARAGV